MVHIADTENNLARYLIAKHSLAQVQAEIARLEPLVLAEMEAERKTSVTVPLGSAKHRLTVVKSNTLKVDEAGLRKAIGAKRFKKFTIQRFSAPLLEDALETGEVKPEEVSPYVSEVPRKTSIRVTEVKQRGAATP